MRLARLGERIGAPEHRAQLARGEAGQRLVGEIGQRYRQSDRQIGFVDRLASKTNVILIKPLDYWGLLDVPKGSPPRTLPHPTNPLIAHDWWMW